jgi:hypothetical protein
MTAGSGKREAGGRTKTESDLASVAIDAHGGLDRWRKFKSLSAHLLQGGGLWKLKGQEDTLKDVNVAVGTRTEWTEHSPFRRANQHTSFTPDRIAIESSKGDVLHERFNPRESFKGHTLETPWDDLQLAYFVGYAMWNYLNTPFLLSLPGVETREIDTWEENGEVWRRLKATFPPSIATHSTEQTFYFDRQGLFRRHDYNVDISGGTPAAHYVSELKTISGITMPTKHRIYPRQPDGTPVPTQLVVSIDVSDVKFG